MLLIAIGLFVLGIIIGVWSTGIQVHSYPMAQRIINVKKHDPKINGLEYSIGLEYQFRTKAEAVTGLVELRGLTHEQAKVVFE